MMPKRVSQHFLKNESRGGVKSTEIDLETLMSGLTFKSPKFTYFSLGVVKSEKSKTLPFIDLKEAKGG